MGISWVLDGQSPSFAVQDRRIEIRPTSPSRSIKLYDLVVEKLVVTGHNYITAGGAAA